MSFGLLEKERLGAFWSAKQNDESFSRVRSMSDDLSDTHFNERLRDERDPSERKQREDAQKHEGAHCLGWIAF